MVWSSEMIGNTFRHVTHVGTSRSDVLPVLPVSASSRVGALPLPLSLFRMPSSVAFVFCLDIGVDVDADRAPTEPPRNAGRPRSTRSGSPVATPLPFPRDAERV